jgi:hypothetical protein
MDHLQAVQDLREGKTINADSDDIKAIAKILTREECQRIDIGEFDHIFQKAPITLKPKKETP